MLCCYAHWLVGRRRGTLRRPPLVLYGGRILLAASAATSFSSFCQAHRWTKRLPPSSGCDVRCLDVRSGQARDGEFATRLLPGVRGPAFRRCARCTVASGPRTIRSETGGPEPGATAITIATVPVPEHSVTAGVFPCKCPYANTGARPLETEVWSAPRMPAWLRTSEREENGGPVDICVCNRFRYFRRPATFVVVNIEREAYDNTVYTVFQVVMMWDFDCRGAPGPE
ncbi:hypothetical protein OKW28_003980 [Paraburkholderia sp. 40]